MFGLFRAFLKDTRGVSALMFGLAVPAIALAVGGGIDLSQAASRRQSIASAVELGCQHAAQEVGYQKRQSGADPNKNYSSVVNTIANKKITDLQLRGVTGVSVSSTVANDVITIQASGASANVFGGILGYNTVSLNVTRNCTAIAAPAGKVLFTESFETGHNVASNSWTVLNNWNGWVTQTGKGGIEINGIPELAANDMRFGNFFAELDSHCYTSGCSTNSNMWREFTLTAGDYELNYWYISRVRNTAADYAGKAICVGRYPENNTNPNWTTSFGAWATNWYKVVDWATWEGQTNRIEAFFEKKPYGNTNTPPTTAMVDVCVHADKWTQRIIPLKVTASGTYRIYFRAAGREDTYGGLIDYIRFCSGKCP
ncbi:TadE/TadG family type IV pilus assembly protein [Bosea sp. NPDC055332]